MKLKKDGWQASRQDVNVTSSLMEFHLKVSKPFILKLFMSDFVLIINQTQIHHKILKIQIHAVECPFFYKFLF